MNKKEKESCGVKEKITGFVDGELAAKERDFVARHLQTCAVCRKEHDASDIAGQSPAFVCCPGTFQGF